MNKIVDENVVKLSKEIDRIQIVELVNSISDNQILGVEIRKYVEFLKTEIEEQQ